MKLWLHIGTPKTGTTSIQSALAHNREALQKQGLLYPDSQPFLGGSNLNHQRLVKDLTSREPQRKDAALNFMASVRQDGAGVALLSGEGFYLRSPGGDKWTTLAKADYWDRRREYVDGLARALPDLDIEVLLVLRDKASFATSLWGQVVFGNGWPGKLDEFTKLIHPLLDYDAQIAIWRRAFPNVKTLSFEDLAFDGKLIERFFGAIDIAPPPFVGHAWERRSPAPRALEWLRTVNAAKPPESVLSAARSFAATDHARNAKDIDSAFRNSFNRGSGASRMRDRIWLQYHRLRNLRRKCWNVRHNSKSNK